MDFYCVEQAFEVTANSFYGNLVAALWVVGVASNLVYSKCDIWMTVVGEIHHEADSALVIPVFFARQRVWRA